MCCFYNTDLALKHSFLFLSHGTSVMTLLSRLMKEVIVMISFVIKTRPGRGRCDLYPSTPRFGHVQIANIVPSDLL